jgi:hypothetical protein
VDMHATDLVGINGITRVLLVYTDFSVAKIKYLMLFQEIIAVSSKDRLKHVHALCGKIQIY